jgi:hypothetical protein
MTKCDLIAQFLGKQKRKEIVCGAIVIFRGKQYEQAEWNELQLDKDCIDHGNGGLNVVFMCPRCQRGTRYRDV